MTDASSESLARAARRVERERRARQEAEQLLERKSRELYEVNCALRTLAQVDPLTHLLNRRSFLEEASKRLAQASTRGSAAAFVLIDLDHFRRLNDSLGHHLADQVLIGAARRLTSALPGASFCRWAGDEFAAIIDVRDEADALALLQRARDALHAEMTIDQRPLRLECSIGAALAPVQSVDLGELERSADFALIEAKRRRRGACVVFDQELRAQVDRRRSLAHALREAISADEIKPWFQPIFGIDGCPTSLEVLARWQAPSLGEVSPATFIPLAGELGLLGDLDCKVAAAALGHARGWVESGLVDSISLNMSPRYVNDGLLVHRVRRMLELSGFAPSGLVLEITEEAVFDDLSAAQKALKELTGLGVRIALDDFGTGYSNLRVLSDLPFSYVKLDRSLVSAIDTDMRARTLLGAVVHLAKTLRLTVVAEGVENEAQGLILRVLGADRVQGYLFGKAMPHLSVHSFLQERLGEAAPSTVRHAAGSPSHENGRTYARG